MPAVELMDLPAALPRGAPVIGLDLGEKTIGVAVSDTSLMIASPLELIRRTKFTTDAEALFKLMDARRGVEIAHIFRGQETSGDMETHQEIRTLRPASLRNCFLLKVGRRS